MTSRNGYTIGWTTYNYPSTVSASGESASFDYGPDRQLWRQIYSGPNGTETTYYLGGLMERVDTSSGSDYRHYIYAGNELVAIYSRTSSGTNTLRYALEDHQGSFSSILTSSGTTYVSESFAPFGSRRSPGTWSGAPSSSDLTAINGVTRIGYTGQTMLGAMGLIHMRGRVVDATIGRFLSPDPYLGDAGSTQSYNGYSYVLNNPLTLVDPSGFADQPPAILKPMDPGPGETPAEQQVVVRGDVPGPFDPCTDCFLTPGELSDVLWLRNQGDPASSDALAAITVLGRRIKQPKPATRWIDPRDLQFVSNLWATPSIIRPGVRPQGDPCANVPALPPGQSVDRNIAIAQAKARESMAQAFSKGPMMIPALSDDATRLDWFYLQVRNKAPWDYKQQGNQYQAGGNFNYGAAGAALGLSDQTLLRGAGWAQQRAGTSDPSFGNWYGNSPYGDDPVDQANIRAGIQYFKTCSNVGH